MNYVISLKSANNRREHIVQEFGKQSVPFEFFDAITPDCIDKYCQQLGIDLINSQRLSQGEKACFFSHVSLWQMMIDKNMDYLVIFEDDIILSDDIQDFLCQDFIGQLMPFDVIKLETFFEKTSFHQKFTHHQRAVGQLKSPHMGAGAYIISKQGVIKLMQHIKNTPITQMMAIDHVIFEAFIHQLMIYQINPAPCVQSMFLDKSSLPSQLETYRQANANNSKKDVTIILKITNIFKRLKRSIGKRTFYQIIPFQ